MKAILDKLSNTALLLPACAFLVLLVIVLVIVLIRSNFSKHELTKQVAYQKERVRVRKKKIYALKNTIKQLKDRIAELEERPVQETNRQDAIKVYQRIAESIDMISARITNELTDTDQISSIREQLMSLSFQVQKALGVEYTTGSTLKSGRAKDSKARKSYIGCRILVADDDSANLEECQEILETAGMLVDRIDSAEGVIEKFRRSDSGYYDMILMDIVMNGMSGCEAASVIRQMHHSDCTRIPIVAMTANNFSEDLQMILRSGMNERIVKPITRENLMPVVKKWLGSAAAISSSSNTQKWDTLDNNKSDTRLMDLFSSLSHKEESIIPQGPSFTAVRVNPAKQETPAISQRETFTTVQVDSSKEETPILPQELAFTAVKVDPAKEKTTDVSKQKKKSKKHKKKNKKNKKKKNINSEKNDFEPHDNVIPIRKI